MERTRLLSLVFALLLLAEGAAGQSTSPTDVPTAARINVAKAGAALEAAVSGSEYRLGPGDSLAVGVWAPEPLIHRLGVSVEGNVIIPGVGELHVDGDVLDVARQRIRSALMRHFRNVEITISLVSVRKFQVHVLGQVEHPGTYLGTAVDRISSAIAWAGELAPNASQRRILVSSGDSVRAQVDLFAFLRRGISDSNPYLRDGDVVYVPFIRDRFVVRGAVNEPAGFEYVPGDRFSDAISFAGGFTSEAFSDTLEVVRYLGVERLPVRFYALAGGDLIPARESDRAHLPRIVGRFGSEITRGPAEAGSYPDFELKPDDLIFVRAIPEYRIKRMVEIAGEVQYPGFYVINEGHDRILDVIQRAGGVTPEAFLLEARHVRREAITLEDREFERLKTIPAADMTDDEYEYFKLRSRENPGLMVVDFQKLLEENDETQNLLLRHGDVITIPKRRDFVSVLGMFQAPGNIIYDHSLTPRDYIDRAGGYAEKADKGKTRVIKASTGVWVSFDDAEEIEPGDTIWVPEKGETHFWETFKEVVAVTTQILTMYLIVDRAVNP